MSTATIRAPGFRAARMNRLCPRAAAALEHQAPRWIHGVVVKQFAQRVGLVGQTIRLAGGVAVNVWDFGHGTTLLHSAIDEM